jgi:hypothetical protein
VVVQESIHVRATSPSSDTDFDITSIMANNAPDSVTVRAEVAVALPRTPSTHAATCWI